MNLQGIGVALVTPFDNEGEIDFLNLEKLINHLINNGIDYIVPIGTTGESVTLSSDEKLEIFRFTAKIAAGRIKLVAGIGGNNTKELIDFMSKFDPTGYSAILSVSPYYNRPNQEGIYQHYKIFAESAPLPVILYNVPTRTGSNLQVSTILRLANEKNIVGIKEASGNMSQCMELAAKKPKDFLLISGDDALTLPLISLGFDGIISVVGNIFPAKFSKMTHFALQGNYNAAREIHNELLEFIDLLFADGSPGGVKAGLKSMGICGDYVRLPLTKVNAEVANSIHKFIESKK